MHGEETITTTSKYISNNAIVNSTSQHQSHHDDGTITVSIIHPHQHTDIGDFIASTNLNAPCSIASNQIVPSQTKIIVSSNDLQTLKEDVSSVIINGTISNTNDPNVLILPATETCDSGDKNSLVLSQLTSSQGEQVEIDLQDVSSLNDEASSREGESSYFLLLIRIIQSQQKLPWMLLLLICSTESERKQQDRGEIIICARINENERETKPRDENKIDETKVALQESEVKRRENQQHKHGSVACLKSCYSEISLIVSATKHKGRVEKKI